MSFLISCGSPSTTTREDLDRAPLGGRIPSEGTIAFFDPDPGGMPGGKRRRPTLVTITTEEVRGTREDRHINVDAGRIDVDTSQGRPTGRRELVEIFKLQSRAATVVSPQRFAELWKGLADVGAFKLPRHRGGIPPENKPSIRMSAEGRTWILLRPTDAPRGSLPRDEREIVEIQRAWANAKLLIVSFF